MRITTTLVALGGSILFFATAHAQSVGFLQDARLQASATWAENLSRTSALPNQKSAHVYAASLFLDHNRQLSRDWLLAVEGDLTGSQVPKFDALDHVTAGVELTARRKFGLGPLAPVLELNAGTHGFRYDESGRSGWQFDGGVRLAKRLAETWRASAGLDWESFSARLEPFDVHHHRAVVETTWDATDRWQVTAGASRLWGQLTANAAGTVWSQAIGGGLGPVIFETYNRLAWRVTDTYGPGWVAYRINCHADSWWLELAPALTERTSLALRYETVKVINEIDIRYDSAFWSLSVVHRF